MFISSLCKTLADFKASIMMFLSTPSTPKVSSSDGIGFLFSLPDICGIYMCITVHWFNMLDKKFLILKPATSESVKTIAPVVSLNVLKD